jgi:tetratricopeptide (TPR) repeat protein
MKSFSPHHTIWLTLGLTFGFLALLPACRNGTHQSTEEWTTSSEEARSCFILGFEAWSKEYYSDAVGNFEKALLLDPGFVAARLFLAACTAPGDPEHRSRLQALLDVDLTALTIQEQFLVRYDLARAGMIDENPAQILDEFLAEYPQDPFGLSARCDVFWQDQEWDAAEPCYHRLLKQHPDLVMAQNRLGFIAMARGRFSEAEERFVTYRYLAPDQALPYQSMGELLTVLGRYEEADIALLQALAIKKDFCEAHRLRIKWRTDANRVEEARELLAHMREIPACGFYSQFGYYCTREARLLYHEGELEATWQALNGECLERRHGFDLLAHRVALATGRDTEAQRMEEALHDYFELLASAELPVYTAFYAAVQAHMEGVRLASMGNLAAAAESFEAVDKRLGYWGGDRASFKLFNRLNWMYALESSGKTARAEALRRKIEAINPRFLDDFQASDLDALVRGDLIDTAP